MPARKKTTSPAPIILTPEQVEAQARREERNAAYLAAREDLLSRAQAIAEKLHPGRVHQPMSRNPEQQTRTLESFRAEIARDKARPCGSDAAIVSEERDANGAIVLTLTETALWLAQRRYHGGIAHVRMGRRAGVPIMIIE